MSRATIAATWKLLALAALTACRAAHADPSSAANDTPAAASFIGINRRWDVLPAPSTGASQHVQLERAAEMLGAWTFDLAGTEVHSSDLLNLARTPPDESLVRAVREALHRPVDLDDFLLFLDDLLAAGAAGLRGQAVCVTPGRARAAGIFVHPTEVFGEGVVRLYADGLDKLNVDRPQEPARLAPAPDGSPPGPGWTARYANPGSESAMLAELQRARPASTFAARLRSLIEQLRQQGAEVTVDSTVRRRERGYLMWGALLLSKATTAAAVRSHVTLLDRLNHKWGLNIPIVWRHPRGWQATVEAARTMADTYAVVYASRRGAHKSDHYDGTAVDLTAVGLPRRLQLTGTDGARMEFDLSAPHHNRDLSLTPPLIEWVEAHFRVAKLRLDYPHWSDAG